jgi:hypothetical protein
MRGFVGRFTCLFILIAIVQCFTMQANAQPPSPQLVDSLQNALSKSQSEKERVKLLTKLSEIIFGTKPDTGRLLGLEAIDLAKEVGARVTGIVGRDGGYTAINANVSLIVPTVNPDTVTPHAESFQAVIWHLLVSHPKLKTNSTKW